MRSACDLQVREFLFFWPLLFWILAVFLNCGRGTLSGRGRSSGNLGGATGNNVT